MSQPLPSQPPSAGDVVHWIATKNPFYAISAAFVLGGLWYSFGHRNDAIETWLLMGSLAAYTVLLAGTAFVLVRYLKLWDDARTLLLLVVLLLLATSVSFDHVLMIEPERGTACYLLGLALALGISEALLRGLRLRLPLLYRVPYYLILGLFFLYPLFVQLLRDADDPLAEPFLWALFGFSTAAALAWLTLLPALRRGQAYLQDNGSPWPWPLYPWSLFAILAVAVPGRALLMCWSLHLQEAARFDRVIFGPYFLVPFGFALAILLLEMGLTLPRRAVLATALAVPLLLVALASIGHNPADPLYRTLRVMTVSMGEYRAFGSVRPTPDPVYARFQEIFAQRLHGDPLFLTLILSACFYAYSALRGARLASTCLTAALVALAMIAPDSLKAGLRAEPSPWPLLAAAVLQLSLAIRRRDFRHSLAGSLCLAAALATAVPLPETAPADLRLGLFAQLVVLALLTLGVVHADQPGYLARCLGAGGVLVLSLVAMHSGLVKGDSSSDPSWTPVVYPLVMFCVLMAYGRLLRHSFSELLAVVIMGWWLFHYSRAGYRSLRQKVPGLDAIVAGLAFFGVALLVSLAKAGVLKSLFKGRWEWPSWLQPTATAPAVVEPVLPPAIPLEMGEQEGNSPQGQPPVSGETDNPG
jgi:hypothetical protein